MFANLSSKDPLEGKSTIYKWVESVDEDGRVESRRLNVIHHPWVHDQELSSMSDVPSNKWHSVRAVVKIDSWGNDINGQLNVNVHVEVPVKDLKVAWTSAEEPIQVVLLGTVVDQNRRVVIVGDQAYIEPLEGYRLSSYELGMMNGRDGRCVMGVVNGGRGIVVLSVVNQGRVWVAGNAGIETGMEIVRFGECGDVVFDGPERALGSTWVVVMPKVIVPGGVALDANASSDMDFALNEGLAIPKTSVLSHQPSADDDSSFKESMGSLGGLVMPTTSSWKTVDDYVHLGLSSSEKGKVRPAISLPPSRSSNGPSTKSTSSGPVSGRQVPHVVKCTVLVGDGEGGDELEVLLTSSFHLCAGGDIHDIKHWMPRDAQVYFKQHMIVIWSPSSPFVAFDGAWCDSGMKNTVAVAIDEQRPHDVAVTSADQSSFFLSHDKPLSEIYSTDQLSVTRPWTPISTGARASTANPLDGDDDDDGDDDLKSIYESLTQVRRTRAEGDPRLKISSKALTKMKVEGGLIGTLVERLNHQDLVLKQMSDGMATLLDTVASMQAQINGLTQALGVVTATEADVDSDVEFVGGLTGSSLLPGAKAAEY